MNNPLKSRPLLLLLLIAFVGVILLVLSPLMKDGQKEKDHLPEKQETLAAFLEQTQGVGEVHLKLCADENGRIVGDYYPTGNIPAFVEKLRQKGDLKLDMSVFVPRV